MATTTFIGSAIAASPSGTTIQITVPAGVTTAHTGVIVWGGVVGTITSVTSPGWTATLPAKAASNSTVAVLTRVGGVTAGQVITITSSGTSASTAVACWYDAIGIDAITATPYTRGGVSLTTTKAPPVITTVADETVLIICTERTLSTPTTVSLSGGTQRVYYEGTSSSTTSILIAEQTQAAIGSTPEQTATYSGASGNGLGLQLALVGPVVASIYPTVRGVINSSGVEVAATLRGVINAVGVEVAAIIREISGGTTLTIVLLDAGIYSAEGPDVSSLSDTTFAIDHVEVVDNGAGSFTIL